jgi:putative methyltransferase (TIGR04325 family)
MTAIGRFRLPRKRKAYSAYLEALNDCTERGYENSDIVKVVVEKTKNYRDRLVRGDNPVELNSTSAYGLCSLLSSIALRDEVNVLDFGGAAGAHYFLAREVLPSCYRLNWLVVETAEMVKQASGVLCCEELRFVSCLDEAVHTMERIDLLYTSGALQCVDKPQDYLKKLVTIGADHILFNRLGLTSGDHDVLTIHESWLSWNGPGQMPSGIEDREVRYPFTFLRESVFVQTLSQFYCTVMIFSDSSGVFAVDNEPIKGLGLLAKRKSTCGVLQQNVL